MFGTPLLRSLSYAPIRNRDRKRAHRRLDDHLDEVDRATTESTDVRRRADVSALIQNLDKTPHPYRQRAIEEIGQVGSDDPAAVLRQVEDLLQFTVFDPWRMAPLTDALTAIAEASPETLLPHLDLFVTAADFHSWTAGHESLSETLATLADRGDEDSLRTLCDGLLDDPNRRHQGLDVLVLIARENPEFAVDYLDEIVEDLHSADGDRFTRACDALVEIARNRPEALNPHATDRLLELAGTSIAHAPTWRTLQTCATLMVLAPETLGACRRPLLTHVRSVVDEDRPVEALHRTYEKHPGQAAAKLLVHLIAERPDAIPASEVETVTGLLDRTAAFYEEHAPEENQGFNGPGPRDDPPAATKLERAADHLRAHHADPEGDHLDPRRDFFVFGWDSPLRNL